MLHLVTAMITRSLPTLLAILLSGAALAAIPARTHQDLSTYLSSATNWAKQLSSETQKARNWSTKAQQALQGIQDSLASVDQACTQLTLESPDEVHEGHFVALRKHREAAASILQEMSKERAKERPNQATLKRTAGDLLAELDSAKHEHELELWEIEHRPHGN